MSKSDLSTPGIEEIERQLRAPATSFRELLLAGAAFANAADCVQGIPDHGSLRDSLPYTWPTVGDLRRLRDALVVAGWRKGEEY